MLSLTGMDVFRIGLQTLRCWASEDSPGARDRAGPDGLGHTTRRNPDTILLAKEVASVVGSSFGQAIGLAGSAARCARSVWRIRSSREAVYRLLCATVHREMRPPRLWYKLTN
jgi:hypothetical protein